MKRNLTPSYLKHSASGRARAVWYDFTGKRLQKLLPGAFNSPESKTAFEQLQLEILTSPRRSTGKDEISVNELLLAYLDYAEQHYRAPNGEQTDEVRHVKTAIQYVFELYGHSPGADFGPKALKAVRQKYIQLGWSRKVVNARVDRIRRAFKWAVSEELIPSSTHHALATVPGLQMGRTAARETEPVGPVDDAVVDATLNYTNRHVRGLIEFQRLTGCRPTEACLLRRSDIDMNGADWEYKPKQHKTAWRGKARCIPIGPKAQELLKGYFTPNISDFLFSPARATEELRLERAAKRKTPKYPSHIKRNEEKRARNRKRPPTDRYTRFSYLTAITRACDRAFPPVGELARREDESEAKWRERLTAEERDRVRTWQREHHWHPNQLRHSYATKARREFGLEAAQVVLGHSRADVTQVYAERDQALAAKVAAQIG